MSTCAIFSRDDLSPAVIVWSNSIKASVLLEWVAASLQDEVGIPVQTLFAFNRHAHQTTVKFSILLVTVVWPSRQKENNDNRILTEWACAFWVLSGGFTNFAEASAVAFRAGTLEAGAFATLHASAPIETRIRPAGRGCAPHDKWINEIVVKDIIKNRPGKAPFLQSGSLYGGLHLHA